MKKSFISATSIPSWSTIKLRTYLYNPAFFTLSNEKSFDTLPKHNGAAFISESFAFNLDISTP